MAEKIRVSASGIVRKGKGKVEPRHERNVTAEACKHAMVTGARVDVKDHNRSARDRQNDHFIADRKLRDDIEV